MIDYNFEDIEYKTPDLNIISNWINFVIKNEKCSTGNITYIFCSDGYLLDVNKKYLKHDYFTDVITFDYTENKEISGDIFISIDSVIDNAKSFNVSHETEFLRVVIHGILHLIGYDDLTDEEEKIIHSKEDYYIGIFENQFAK